ncbi:Thioredoxin domain-containing protein 3 [Thoreauomyces humboldtii]|nr:Thioredoxin domain-containing protein 3 [Thoreauomyces humboldtii]
MSAHARKVEIAGAASVSTDEEWDVQIQKPCLTVADVYSKWSGPCEPMQNIFKRLKLDFGERVNFVMAQTDTIEALASFRNKSCPTFLFFFEGVLVKLVKGANAPGIEKTIKEQLELEQKGLPHVALRLDNLLASTSTPGNPQPIDTSSLQAAMAQPSEDSPTTPFTPMSATGECTLAIIKPDAMAPAAVGQIMDVIRRNRFDVVQRRKVWLTPAQVEELYKEHEKAAYFQGVLTHMSTAPVLALVLQKENAVAEWRKIMGPSSTSLARDSHPSTLRALLGTDNRLNAVYGSETLEAAQHEIDVLFGPDVLELPVDEKVFSSSAPQEKTLAIIKPDMIDAEKVDEIVERIVCRGYQVLKRETVQLTAEEAGDLYSHQKEHAFYQDAVAFMSSGPIVALVLKGSDVIAGWREMIGPLDPVAAKATLPMSVRALFGTDPVRNAVHGSDSAANSHREITQLFPSLLTRADSTTLSRPATAHQQQHQEEVSKESDNRERTCALIKPDAFAAGHKDEILERIAAAGFKVVEGREVELTRAQAEEFYKEHQGAGFYEELVGWMSTPDLPIYAMVLERDTAITAWRELAGPTNSQKAREVAPESIRALFGTDGSKNAVHGSDSPQSAEREIKVIFGDSVSPYPPKLELPPAAKVTKPSPAPSPRTEALETSSPQLTRTLALIKPDAYGAGKRDEILAKIKADGFTIVKEAEERWSADKAKEFYKEHEGKGFYDDLVAWMSSAPIYAMVLEKADAVKGWRDLAGPTNSNTARETSPNSIRALFGTDGSKNAVHGSDSAPSASREINIVFGNDVSPFSNHHSIPHTQHASTIQQTLALIKPDVYPAKKDDIVQKIKEAGFRIVKEEEVQMTSEKAGEFYREHAARDFYTGLVEWMSSVPIYAMVLEKEDAVAEWRLLAGPTNSEKARESAPHSIRAHFGTDGSKNAVHGSDSPTSATREIRLMFPDHAGSIPAHHTVPTATSSGTPIQRTLALIKPDVYPARKEDVVKRIKEDGFTIAGEKEITMSEDLAREFYGEHVGKGFYDGLVSWMSSAPIYALVLEKESAITAWRSLAGPTNSVTARTDSPTSIRALYGTDGSKNAVHGSDSPSSAVREITLLFKDEVSPYAVTAGVKAEDAASHRPTGVTDSVPVASGQLTDDARQVERTLALIKPDVYGLHKDAIIRKVQEASFVIVKESEVVFSAEKAGEFYGEHKGKPFYDTLVGWMSSAPIYAMVLEKEGAVKGWRELAGPTNSETARKDAPESIRALYGTDGSQNAVHGSDSIASATREIALVFGSDLPISSDPVPKPPVTAKPITSARPSATQALSTAPGVKRSTNQLNRAPSQKSVVNGAPGSKAPSRVGSVQALSGKTGSQQVLADGKKTGTKGSTASLAKDNAGGSKAGSRVASKADLAGTAKEVKGSRSSALGL